MLGTVSMLQAKLHSAGTTMLHPVFSKELLGTPLVAVGKFTWSEIYNRVPVAMVSEKFARDYWHD